MSGSNQNPEQIARDEIDRLLAEAGWQVQNKSGLDFDKGLGIAVRALPPLTLGGRIELRKASRSFTPRVRRKMIFLIGSFCGLASLIAGPGWLRGAMRDHYLRGMALGISKPA